MKKDELLFVLDIGTRSVIGIVGRAHDGVLEILQVESEEYSGRAVVDGQIEDIEKTAKVAAAVKARLEKGVGATLCEVHVAAAGRVLKTERTFFEMEVDERQPLGAREVMALEAAAVQKAYESLVSDQRDGEPDSFCTVGHTAVGFQLDGYSYATLLGHRGKKAGVDMITTFLPSEVSESLYATMSLLGLSIASITLEPIAAMNAVVPKELHLLNIALVDVGAGTSDIAVADKGGVCGYTMVTVAGDEVTERIMQEFLVDFEMAERMKFAAGTEETTIDYEDILGLSHSVEKIKLLEQIQPTVADMARQIAEGIKNVNGAPPKAVFMVGGGSRTPGLVAQVAEALSIDVARIAIGGSNYMKRQVQAEPQYLGAEFATPIGIAVTAMGVTGNENLSVSLNGVQLQLVGNSMTVMEALRRGGYRYGQIMGRSGQSIVFEYNGERKMVRGGLHTLAEIQVNGELAGLSTALQPGDEISFAPALDGEDAAVLLREIAAPWNPFEVELFGETVSIGSIGWINGIGADGERQIHSQDKVEVKRVETVGELLEMVGFEGSEKEVLLNGRPCPGPEQKLKEGDCVALRTVNVPQPFIPATAPETAEETQTPGLHIVLNNWEYTLLPLESGEAYQFFHLFNHVDIDPNEPKGEIVLLRNGRQASYLEPIQDGDQIEIRWSQEDAAERVPHSPSI